jgi:ABC-2 type transport system ATP-binding protein
MGTVEELKQAVSERAERTTPVTMNEVFMHYTASHLITEADIARYGSWEKAFEAYEAQREDEEE